MIIKGHQYSHCSIKHNGIYDFILVVHVVTVYLSCTVFEILAFVYDSGATRCQWP